MLKCSFMLEKTLISMQMKSYFTYPREKYEECKIACVSGFYFHNLFE